METILAVSGVISKCFRIPWVSGEALRLLVPISRRLLLASELDRAAAVSKGRLDTLGMMARGYFTGVRLKRPLDCVLTTASRSSGSMPSLLFNSERKEGALGRGVAQECLFSCLFSCSAMSQEATHLNLKAMGLKRMLPKG